MAASIASVGRVTVSLLRSMDDMTLNFG
jgi:hypothetical protein